MTGQTPREWVPIRSSSFLGSRPTGQKPKAYLLIKPDPGKYLDRFRRFDFWDVAPITETVIARHADVENEPALPPGPPETWAGDDAEGLLRTWIAWFACQPADVKERRAAEGRLLGENDLVRWRWVTADGRPAIGEEPRELYRCGTMLLGLPEEEVGRIMAAWGRDSGRWLAWYAAAGEFGNEAREAKAWNRGIEGLGCGGHVREVPTTVTRQVDATVVDRPEVKEALSTAITAARREFGIQSTWTHNLTLERSEVGRRIPKRPLTRQEFEAAHGQAARAGLDAWPAPNETVVF